MNQAAYIEEKTGTVENKISRPAVNKTGESASANFSLEKPVPLDIKWICKPVETAESGIEILTDGRLRCWIRHEIVRGVTPKMLVWWFKNLEGEVEIEGKSYNRYRVWHPRDHLFARYAKRNADGSIGVGSRIHLAEMFGANPKYLVDTVTEIVKLDEEGYVHRPRLHGLRLVEMEYSFEEKEDGTLYCNSLTVGVRGGLGKIINPLIRKFVFDRKRGEAWIKHNIEEVGNFEFFLPDLYFSKTGNSKFAFK